MNALNDASSSHREHFLEQAFGAFGGAPPQVAFTALGTHQHPRPCQTEALGGGFMGF